MTPITIRINSDLYKRIKELSANSKIPINTIINYLITNELKDIKNETNLVQKILFQ